jgi:hypothetical protein
VDGIQLQEEIRVEKFLLMRDWLQMLSNSLDTSKEVLPAKMGF